MAKRKAKTAAARLGEVETMMETLGAEVRARVEEVEHQVTAIASLAQREGAWDVRTFARFLSVSSRVVREMVSRGAVPCHRVGGSIRFTPEDRARFLEETAVVPSADGAEGKGRRSRATPRNRAGQAGQK